MKVREICEGCKKRFPEKALAKAWLEKGEILLECPLCGRVNVLLTDVRCDYSRGGRGGWGIAWSCPNEPVECSVVYCLKEFKFRCLCRDHARAAVKT